ncbi:hypothetical protein HanRHA438_Chr10g0452071 [Helianthus annuus]|nr:hypothetical protein HanRHA438_Chr10g0452071 [Helianthus annuus]
MLILHAKKFTLIGAQLFHTNLVASFRLSALCICLLKLLTVNDPVASRFQVQAVVELDQKFQGADSHGTQFIYCINI